MELNKIKEDVNIPYLINEISDIVKLKIEEDIIISKYKRKTAINMAMENLKSKSEKVRYRATVSCNIELLEIERDIVTYQLLSEPFAEFWKPTKLIRTKENEDFKNDEDFKRMVQDIRMSMEIDMRNAECEIRSARAILRRYSNGEESEDKENE